MSQLKRDLMKLQKSNKLGTSSGFSAKSNSHPNKGGKVKYFEKDKTGADRTPQTTPEAKGHTKGVKWFKPTPTGKATPTKKIKTAAKSYKSMPGM